MTTTKPADPAAGLPDRARRAAETYRATDPRTFGTRHANWARWTRRATTAHAIATALDVPADAVTVTNDNSRAYGISGQYPGDLITVTDPATGRAYPFIPDAHAHGHGWLLLCPCDTCTAPVPVARVAPHWTHRRPTGHPNTTATPPTTTTAPTPATTPRSNR